MSRAGKSRNDRRFFYWIYRVSDAAARAEWLHSLIHKASICKSVSGFFYILIDCVSAVKVGVAKNMRVVLRKWTPRDKDFKYWNFPTHLRLSLFLGCFGEIWGQIYIPYKFAQSGCIRPKIECEILAHKGSPTILSRLLKPQTNRTTGPPNVNDDGSIFPG